MLCALCCVSLRRRAVFSHVVAAPRVTRLVLGLHAQLDGMRDGLHRMQGDRFQMDKKLSVLEIMAMQGCVLFECVAVLVTRPSDNVVRISGRCFVSAATLMTAQRWGRLCTSGQGPCRHRSRRPCLRAAVTKSATPRRV